MSGLRWKFVIFSLMLFYILFMRQSFIWYKTFNILGYDYTMYRETAKVALAEGFSQAYMHSQVDEYQAPLIDYSTEGSGQITNSSFPPVPYLPIFVIPFIIVLPIDPIPGFILFTIFNLILLVGYLVRFLRAIDYQASNSILLPIMLSWPVFFTLINGSTNIWLLIFVGEAVIAFSRGNEFRSGMWLAGLLIKPQLLLLLIPGMLISRRFKMFTGFSVSSAVIVLVSLLLAGVDGIISLFELIVLYSGGVQPAYPTFMMNFRNLAINLSGFLSPQISWGIAIIGMTLTALIGLALWRQPFSTSSKEFQIVLLGTYAATGAVTWHSHTYMALPLVVLLLCLFRHDMLSENILYASLLAPAVIFAIVMMVMEKNLRNLEYAFRWVGLATLALNIYLVGWAATNLGKSSDGTGKNQGLA